MAVYETGQAAGCLPYMVDAAKLRRKAAQSFKNAASAVNPMLSASLNELGKQLELWAEELERDAASGTVDGKSPRQSRRSSAC